MTKQSEILDNSKYLPILDHGFVGLVDTMPAIDELEHSDELGSGDKAIVQAARVSYGVGTKKVSDDRNLIRYLLRHKHTSPFEMVDLKFHCKMPILVARQWVRHRTVAINEYSGRYSEMVDEFYIPDLEHLQPQSKDNKQGRDGVFEDHQKYSVQKQMSDVYVDCYTAYKAFLEQGVAKELARSVLPVANYTEWYWKISLHNLFHFIKLRSDPHAQYEIRVYSDAMLKLIEPLAPVAIQAFKDYSLNAITFSAQEMEILKDLIAIDEFEFGKYDLSKRECEEFKKKLEHN